MKKDDLYNIVNVLKEKSVDFRLDTHINIGKSFFRGVFVLDKDKNEIKNILGNGYLNEFKLRKSYVWYLGEKKRAILLKPKDELILEIPDVESLTVNNYA